MKSGKMLSFFLVTMMLTTCFGFINFMPTASADDLGFVTNSPVPVVYVYPNYTTVGVGENFTIALVGFNFTNNMISDPLHPGLQVPIGNIYGFDIEFTWDPEILHCVSHTVTSPAETYPAPNTPSPYGGVLHSPPTPLQVVNVVDEAGNIPGADPETRAQFAYATYYPASPQNGNCTFFTMTFNVLTIGASPLRIVKCDLASPEAEPIFKTVKDGLYRTVGVPMANFDYRPTVAVVNVPIDFNATISGNITDITTYIWDFGGEKQNTTVPMVSHTFTAVGEYAVTLRVLDTLGTQSALVTKHLTTVVRDLRVAKVTIPQVTRILIGNMINVSATIENSGGIVENFTAYAYYNTTIVNATSPEDSDWALIDSGGGNVSAALPGVNGTRTVNIPFNTTALTPMKYYYLYVNVTGIPPQFERDLTDNHRLSNTAIFATNETEHDVQIISFDCVWRSATGTPVIRSPPLIEGEPATIRLTVKNNGTSVDTANITLYSDNVVIQQFELDLNWGETKVVDPWQESLVAGNHNLTLLVQAGSSVANATQMVRVIKPPQIQVTVSPSDIIANQTLVTLSSDGTVHQDPEGTITSRTWRIFAPGLSWTTASPTAIVNGTTATYTFTETGNWTVILDVTDNYGLTYETRRTSTSAYMRDVQVTVRAAAEGFPLMYVLAIVLVAVAVAAAALVIFIRRRRVAPAEAKKESAET